MEQAIISRARACSWCDRLNKVYQGRITFCGDCGHRADVARLDCDCGAKGCRNPRAETPAKMQIRVCAGLALLGNIPARPVVFQMENPAAVGRMVTKAMHIPEAALPPALMPGDELVIVKRVVHQSAPTTALPNSAGEELARMVLLYMGDDLEHAMMTLTEDPTTADNLRRLARAILNARSLTKGAGDE